VPHGELHSRLLEIEQLLVDSLHIVAVEHTDGSQTLDLQKFKTAAAADAAAEDYYYKLALQQLKRQWELEDRARGL
jgi:hypothetical protein